MLLPKSGHWVTALQRRRHQLAELIDFPVILWSGSRCSRNFPANHFPFRASSHFLYFAGVPLENAAIYLAAGQLTLFLDQPPTTDALWYGEVPQRHEFAALIGADAALPLGELATYAADAATIPVQDMLTRQQQAQVLGRSFDQVPALQGQDLALARAIVQLRLIHDEVAIAELSQAAAATIMAHQAGLAATRKAKTEAEIRAAMEGVFLAQDLMPAYASIVTVAGEVLHNSHYHQPLNPGDLLLADVGAETQLGWAADVTRTWPVSGSFSSTQQEIYQIVLAAHDACIAAIQPGVEFRDLHLLAAKTITEGLVSLGIFRGQVSDLMEQQAYALFFPHGVGHLLGLDVHDMEDLGDLAGYEPGRQRSDRWGLKFLRLDRPLRSGMLVTIEPGFYQVPAILQDPQRRTQYSECVNWERLSQFADVRGIRIEDDILVTATGYKVLSADLPTAPEAITELIQQG